MTPQGASSIARKTNAEARIMTSRTHAIGRHLLLALCSLTLCVNALAQTPAPSVASAPLTMQQAVDLARAKNPSLLSAQQTLLSVKAQELQAGVRLNPSLTLGGQNVSLEARNPSASYFYNAQIARTFELGQKRRWRLDAARSTTSQTDAQYHSQEQQTILAVRQSFTNFVLAKAAKKLADDNLRDYKHEVDIARDRMNAGDISKLDFKRLDLQLAQFESDESSATTNAQRTSIQLQVLLGYTTTHSDFDVIGDIVP